jgi:hypothetical protein
MACITIVDNKQEWDGLVALFEHSDFYHTYEYHQIAKGESDRPILIKYSESDKLIVLPLLLRKIEDHPYWDATSVYGYPGPLTKNINAQFNNVPFNRLLQELLIEQNIISVFSRLNPFIPYQEIVLKNIGNISFKGRIVNIDLFKELKCQKKDYNRRLKSYINQCRSHCTVKLATTKADILTFIDLYYENMHRVHAANSYFFNKDYFFALVNAKDFKTETLLAVHNDTGKIVSAAMFVKKNNIVQYHLSGSSGNYLHLNALKMLIDEMGTRATAENYQYYNLGGGVSGNEDSLFHFKSCFSKDYKEFKLWKYIVIKSVYQELSDQKLQKEYALLDPNNNDFFPRYRQSK